jgi:hypothetical protein
MTVGDNTVIDFSNNAFPFTNLNSGTCSVLYDTSLNSNVMNFTGAVFSTPMVPALNFSTKDFEIECVYKTTESTSTIQVIYGTGYFPDYPNRIAGIAHQIGQYSGQDQYFVDDGVNYTRHLIAGANYGIWQKLVYRKTSANGVSINRYNAITGALLSTITYSNILFGAGQQFGIGGYYKTLTTNRYNGYIQHVRIKLL